MRNPKKPYCVALDVGGTFVKSALIASDGSSIQDSFQTTPIPQESAEAILATFAGAVARGFRLAEHRKLDVAGIGVSIAGPFDIERGISLMKHKLAPIYGVNLRREFRKRLALQEDFLIRFEPDAWAFLRGEAWQGVAKSYRRIIGATIGTGLGSGFMVNSSVVVEGPGVPRFGWLGGLPYNGGILESRISRSGIIARYRELAGEEAEGLDVKEIASLVLERKNKIGLQVFREVGAILGGVLRPIASEFQADCIVLGGQVSKSFSLFARCLKAELRPVPTLKKVAAGRSLDLSALYGVTQVLFGPPTLPPIKFDEQTLRALGAYWE